MMWRQLCVLWRTPVRYLPDGSISPDVTPVAFSTAAADGGVESDRLWSRLHETVPGVVFIAPGDSKEERPIAEGQSRGIRRDGCSAECRVVLTLTSDSTLASGLPKRIAYLGPRPDFVYLDEIAKNGHVLVSADGLPVIVERRPHLFMGVSPWQLGSPVMPYLYPLLKAWLSQRAGLETMPASPLAAFRFDDLPATAHEVISASRVDELDHARAATIGRLRRFANERGVVMSFAYSTHFPTADGFGRIADRMPCSVAELKKGQAEGSFEIGSHGMVHLRHPGDRRPEAESDHREFIDLDERATEDHIAASKGEIERAFGLAPRFFVAPAWAYRQGVTKPAAAKHAAISIDSTQHVESGDCPPIGATDPETQRPSLAETFRPGASLLNFTNPDFWRCYAVAGIPIHFMQHSDVDRDRLGWVIRGMAAGLPQSGRLRRLVLAMDSASTPAYRRAVAAFVIAVNGVGFGRAVALFLREARLDVYRVMGAALSAGYRCVAVSALYESLSTRG